MVFRDFRGSFLCERIRYCFVRFIGTDFDRIIGFTKKWLVLFFFRLLHLWRLLRLVLIRGSFLCEQIRWVRENNENRVYL